MVRRRYKLLLFGIWLALFGILEIAPNGRGVWAVSNQHSGQAVELTVYNQNLALVKESRRVQLASGITRVNFTGVAALIDPASVKFAVSGLPGFRVLEQNYEYDVINDLKLLQKYLGAKIKITDLQGNTTEGYLINAAQNVIISTRPEGGEVRILKANQIQAIVFPELPDGLITKPTLVWLVQNPYPEGEHSVTVSYLTQGLSWQADYVATINAGDNRLDLTGWVTLNNQSGSDYQNARLKLVAGDLNLAPEEKRTKNREILYKAAASTSDQAFEEQSFFEYHLYTLSRPTTIKNFQVKQVELLTAAAVPAQKLYVYEGAVEPEKVKVMLEVTNSREQNLGMPLPKGKIRVQKADADGSLQLIGEDRIDHTPQNEKLRIKLGYAFDITGDRIKTEVREVTHHCREESYRIKLRNHKAQPVTVTAVEKFSPWLEWKIVKKDHPYIRNEAGKAEFTVVVPPNGEKVVNYTVRYQW